MLYTNKRLQNTKRYKEYQTLIDKYYKLSLSKEEGQINYLKKYKLIDPSSNQPLETNYSFEKYYKKYTKSIEQKVYTIESIAKEKNLVPVFITLTLPTQYHPFKSISYNGKRLYTALNQEFAFKDIDSAIHEGYNLLNSIYRIFYKRVKNNVKELMYIKVVETHKTYIPHFHILFYVKNEDIKIIRKNFVNICNEFNLSQYDLELVANENELKEKENHNINTKVNRASKYIMKYITKSLSNGEDFYKARILDGWKRLYKIRMITMSNLDLSLSDFRTIYHNLDTDSKDNILSESKREGKSIFYYILKNIYKLKIIQRDNKKTIKEHGSIKSKRFILITSITQSKKFTGGYRTQIDNFKFFIDYKLVYDKPKYIKECIKQ